ncbi:uncharacterized protein SPPG_02961 [Spizellomyces punctatus DAOM BR117]|uniref:ATPase inhibitor, mitochondrial n=1 Tax=Spizellomyces punctatus (strain DAOM BR117) TaxID=645134 RepID=A0A0L0HN34_SPIPD|nr:uncharacterized protein SPPG_02961 [Spizellomyces punctatus DAOM BR117]KND02502.1 hypothetical protein SPPG_02961 [Spizellomyces punctatus DAOM BR117]|eukprot:XP_016610541.1 hypothetical protein SPPG_02961 [Spizellomyces punctatus DAOM BR117]
MSALRLVARPLRTVPRFTRAMTTNIRDAGGAFAKREATEEERYAWEHEKEVIKKLREQLKLKEQAAKKKLEKDPSLDPQFHKELEKSVHLHGKAGSDAFSKRESAAEERYIREHEREVAERKTGKK